MATYGTIKVNKNTTFGNMTREMANRAYIRRREIEDEAQKEIGRVRKGLVR